MMKITNVVKQEFPYIFSSKQKTKFINTDDIPKFNILEQL